jgi:MFS family permease
MMTICFGNAPLALFLPDIGAEVGLSAYTAQSLLFGALFAGFTVAILASGSLADRIGFRWILVAGSLLQAVGLVVISLAHSQWAALAGACVVGLGGGVADALFTPIICAVFPRRRTSMTGLLHAFYAVGVVTLVALMLALALRAHWPWRPIFRLVAVLALPYGVIVVFLRLPAQSHEGPARLRGRQLLRRLAFWAFLGAIFMGAMTELGPGNWLPTLLQESAGGGLGIAGAGLILFGSAMLVGRLGVAAVVDRLGPRLVLVAAGLICAAGLLLAALPLGAAWSVCWLTVMGLGVGAFWPTIIGCAGDRYPQAGASMFSLLSASGNFAGIAGPMIVGAVADVHGLQAGMAVLAVAPILVAAIMLGLLKRPTKG